MFQPRPAPRLCVVCMRIRIRTKLRLMTAIADATWPNDTEYGHMHARSDACLRTYTILMLMRSRIYARIFTCACLHDHDHVRMRIRTINCMRAHALIFMHAQYNSTYRYDRTSLLLSSFCSSTAHAHVAYHPNECLRQQARVKIYTRDTHCSLGRFASEADPPKPSSISPSSISSS